MSVLVPGSIEVVSELCIFCYKNVANDCDKNETRRRQGRVHRFFTILEKLFREKVPFRNLEDSDLQQIASTLCEDCEKILGPIFDIYHEIKCLELKLNWKLEIMKNVAQLADNDPSRVKSFRETVGTKLGYNEVHGEENHSRRGIGLEEGSSTKILRELMTARRNLMKQWDKYLINSSPRVIIEGGYEGNQEVGFNHENLIARDRPHQLPVNRRWTDEDDNHIQSFFIGWTMSFVSIILLYLLDNGSVANVMEAPFSSVSLGCNIRKSESVPIQQDKQVEVEYSDVEWSDGFESSGGSPKPNCTDNVAEDSEDDFSLSGACRTPSVLSEQFQQGSNSFKDEYQDPKPVLILRVIKREKDECIKIGADEDLDTLKSKSKRTRHPHNRKVASEIFKFRCPICCRKYSSKFALEYHQQTTHSKLTSDRLKVKFSPDGMTIDELVYKKHAKFQCDVRKCRKLFHTLNDLEKHSKLHGNFPCSICDQVEDFAPNLALHEAQHCKKLSETENKAKWFHCARCDSKAIGKEWKYVDHFLKEHLRLSVDTIRCPICEVQFKYTSDTLRYCLGLVGRIYFHYVTYHKTDGLQKIPNTCDQCPAYFLQPDQLIKHKQRAHNSGSEAEKYCYQTFPKESGHSLSQHHDEDQTNTSSSMDDLAPQSSSSSIPTQVVPQTNAEVDEIDEIAKPESYDCDSSETSQSSFDEKPKALRLTDKDPEDNSKSVFTIRVIKREVSDESSDLESGSDTELGRSARTRMRKTRKISSAVVKTLKVKKFKCPDCSMKFRKKYDLKFHRATHIPKQDLLDKIISPNGMTIEELVYKNHANFHCNINTCTKDFLGFHTQEELDKHSKLHGNFACSVCGHVEDFAQNLALHEAQHCKDADSGDKSKHFSCVRCGSKSNPDLKLKWKYIDHFLEEHLGVCRDKIMCPICQAEFNGALYASNLVRGIFVHYSTHHEKKGLGKILKCGRCPAYFLRSAQLRKHKRRVHDITILEH